MHQLGLFFFCFGFVWTTMILVSALQPGPIKGACAQPALGIQIQPSRDNINYRPKRDLNPGPPGEKQMTYQCATVLLTIEFVWSWTIPCEKKEL